MPANAVGQAKWLAQADRLREQAHSYSESALAGSSASCREPVGAGLLANAVYQSKWMAQADRFRGQARSYIDLRPARNLRTVGHGFWSALNALDAAEPVGVSLLAIWRAAPVNRCMRCVRHYQGVKFHDRSAADRGTSHAPTVDRRRSRKSRLRANRWAANAKSDGLRKTCGSRLAGECGGSGDIDGTGRPLSRASSLLH